MANLASQVADDRVTYSVVTSELSTVFLGLGPADATIIMAGVIAMASVIEDFEIQVTCCSYSVT